MSRTHLFVPLIVALPCVAGCYATVEPVQPSIGVQATYSPLRYHGYVVYYDAGEPYYVVRNRRYYIPRSHPRYRTYVRHYQTYRDNDGYRRWRRDHSPRYQTRGPRVRDVRRYHPPR